MGREQKYANVLDDSSKKEEELSKTRSLKNKDLYDKDDFEHTAPISIDELKQLHETKQQELPPVVEEEPKEDIYITSSFKPLKKRLKLKKTIKYVIVILILLLIGLGLFFFLLRPAYQYYLNSKPINVFYNSIDSISDYIIDELDEDLADKHSLYTNFEFKVNTNDKDISPIGGKTYGFTLGADTKNNSLEEFVYFKDNDKKYGRYYFEKDGKYYNMLSSDDVLYDVTDYVDKDDALPIYGVFKDYLKDISTINSSDTKKYIEAHRDFLKDFITKDMVSSKKDTIEVDGKNINVIRNTLKMDKKKLEEFDKEYYKKFLEDDELVRIACNLFGLTKEEYKDSYELEEYDDEDEFVINIYTIKGTQVVGFDIEQNGFTDIYVYTDDKDFEAHFNLTDDEDKCDGKKDCVKDNQLVYDIKGEYDKTTKSTEVIIKLNKEDWLELNVKSFKKEKIEFDFVNYTSDEGTEKGSFLLTKEDDSYNLDLSAKMNDEYLNMTLSLTYSYDKKVADIDISNATEYSKTEWEESTRKFNEILRDKNISEGYVTWFNLYVTLVTDLTSEYDKLAENISL